MMSRVSPVQMVLSVMTNLLDSVPRWNLAVKLVPEDVARGKRVGCGGRVLN